MEQPDVNNVSAVAITKYTELTGNPSSYFSHNGKKYDRKFEYDLYLPKDEYIIPMEYEDVEKTGDIIGVCYKDGEILVVETEKVEKIMIVTLYEPFRHWSEGGSVCIILNRLPVYMVEVEIQKYKISCIIVSKSVKLRKSIVC